MHDYQLIINKYVKITPKIFDFEKNQLIGFANVLYRFML